MSLFFNWIKLLSWRGRRLLSRQHRNAPPKISKVFSSKCVDFFHLFDFLLPPISIDNFAEDLVTLSLPIFLFLSFSISFAVFFLIQTNSISFLNFYYDNISSFFLRHIIIWNVLYDVNQFTSITPNHHMHNANHHFWFLIRCWNFYELWSWSVTSTELI